jgi:hypothetical protein
LAYTPCQRPVHRTGQTAPFNPQNSREIKFRE